ncbi:hypothetical protein [Trueperella pecoris]|uniref:hypothetical protein n=1 Tax=Trueperella pecoris TaxID=2733571 RepID=UPI001C20C62E|nr:hypothetical protein [Trueperella pecoris]
MRSNQRSIFVLATLFVLINLVARDWDWRYEWTRASMSLAFLSVMIAPLFAGLSAWWAAQMVPALDDVLAMSPRHSSVVLREVTRLFRPVAAALGLGGLAMAIACTCTGGFFATWPDVWPMLSALMLIYVAGVVGFVSGGAYPRLWLAPVVTLGIFGLILGLYGTHLAPLVQAGGASASLVGVVPHWRFHLVGIVASLLIAFGVLKLYEGGRRRSARNLAVGVLLVIVSAGGTYILDSALAGDGISSRLALTDKNVTCVVSPEGYEICLGRGYGSVRPAVEEAVAHVSEQLAELGVEVPRRWDQRGGEDSAYVNPLEKDLAASVRWEAINRQIPPQCNVGSVREAVDIVSRYGETGVITDRDETLRAFEALKAC